MEPITPPIHSLCHIFLQFVLPEIISLADDPVFRVRKAAALKLGSLCSAVGEQLSVQRLLPVYEVLARDEIWGVRKASVESMAEVAAVMPVEVRTSQLVALFQEFHEDGSRWVRIAACQVNHSPPPPPSTPITPAAAECRLRTFCSATASPPLLRPSS